MERSAIVIVRDNLWVGAGAGEDSLRWIYQCLIFAQHIVGPWQ